MVSFDLHELLVALLIFILFPSVAVTSHDDSHDMQSSVTLFPGVQVETLTCFYPVEYGKGDVMSFL